MAANGPSMLLSVTVALYNVLGILQVNRVINISTPSSTAAGYVLAPTVTVALVYWPGHNEVIWRKRGEGGREGMERGRELEGGREEEGGRERGRGRERVREWKKNCIHDVIVNYQNAL